MSTQVSGDPLDKLEGFIAAMVTAREAIEESSEVVEEQAKAFDAFEDDVEAKAGAFGDQLEEFTEAFETAKTDLATAIDTLAGVAGIAQGMSSVGGGEVLGDGEPVAVLIETEIGEATAQLEAAFDAFKNGLEENFGELFDGGFAAVAEMDQILIGLMENLTEEAKGDFDGFAGLVEEVVGNVTDAQNLLAETYGAAATAVTDTFSDASEEAFGIFSTALADTTKSDLIETAGELLGNFKEMFDNLGNEIEETGEELITSAGEMLADSAKHVGETVLDHLEESVKEAIEEVIASLMADFAESTAMMAAGAATTTALSPYLPQLAAAKTVVGAINDLLEALNPFD